MILMRNSLFIIILLVLFTSCDDGDIIINNFDFEDANLKSCNKTGKSKVLYKINNDNIFETISLRVNNADFSDLAGVLSSTSGEIRIPLPSSNGANDAKLIYRTYDEEVQNDYFCGDIPPSSPKVREEFLSLGGTIVIVTAEDLGNTTDQDRDGILDVDEFDGDTDDDGIPDIQDVDDDGDNVLTSTENANAANDNTTEDGLRDTDEDDIPNYLDPDDDGDEVLTKFEVTMEYQLPTASQNTNDAGLAFYLDRFSINSFMDVTKVLDNILKVRYRSIISIEDLQLQNQNGSGEEISFESYQFGEFSSILVDKDITPNTGDSN
jgi:hypothetical protein